MSEIVKISYKLAAVIEVDSSCKDMLDDLIDFLVHTLTDMLSLYENVVLNIPELTLNQKLFIPISKMVEELEEVGSFAILEKAVPVLDQTKMPTIKAPSNGLDYKYNGNGQTYATQVFQATF
jgi:hypothetical protein